MQILKRVPRYFSLTKMPTACFSERLQEIERRSKEKLINGMQSTESPKYWVTSGRPADFGDPLESSGKPDNWYQANRLWNEEDEDYKTKRTKIHLINILKYGVLLNIAVVIAKKCYENWLINHKYRVKDTYAEYDISNLKPGEIVKTDYLGEPIFLRLLTRNEVAEMIKLDEETQYDKESYVSTTPVDSYQLLVVSAKTNKGTIPNVYEGKYKGWYCPVTGQVFDKFGRIRKDGKPGKNLQYLNNTLHGKILCLEQKMDYYSNYCLYYI